MQRTLCAALWVLSFSSVYAADYSSMSGDELYQKFCASCHGASAQGDGPIAKSLRKKPSDLTQIARRYGGVFPTKRMEEVVDGRIEVAAHGPSAMPVWGQEFTRDQEGAPAAERDTAQVIHKIVAHLRSLQANSASRR
jgi:mono/diheme cytochrome c family protein